MSGIRNYFKVIAPLVFLGLSPLPAKANIENLVRKPLMEVLSDTIHKNGPAIKGVKFKPITKTNKVKPQGNTKEPVNYNTTINVYLNGENKSKTPNLDKDSSGTVLHKVSPDEFFGKGSKNDSTNYGVAPLGNKYLRKSPYGGIYSSYGLDNSVNVGLFGGVPINASNGLSLELMVGGNILNKWEKRISSRTEEGAPKSIGNNLYTMQNKTTVSDSSSRKIGEAYLMLKEFVGKHWSFGVGAFAKYFSHKESSTEFGKDYLKAKDPNGNFVTVQEKNWNKGIIKNSSGKSIDYGPSVGINYNPSRNFGFSLKGFYDVVNKEFGANAGIRISLASQYRKDKFSRRVRK